MARAFDAGFQANAFQTGPSGADAAFLVVGDLIIAVAVEGADGKSTEHRLDRQRTFGGVMHRSRQGVWRSWFLHTRTLTKADARIVKAQLTTTALPVRCEGSLFKSLSPTNGVWCFPVLVRLTPSPARGDRWVVEFELHETTALVETRE